MNNANTIRDKDGNDQIFGLDGNDRVLDKGQYVDDRTGRKRDHGLAVEP
jgi:hypothetical protein